jgi:tripartite-type tricarboxylate transporter receptor subunit TctC
VTNRRKLLIVVLAALSVIPAAGAEYPTKPIRLIMPAAAGGGPDINARLIAAELSKQMGQQVVVDNRPGASNIIGFELIARAVPDIPTIAEAGLPGYEMDPSGGYILPARVPRDIVLRLNDEINKALMAPSVVEKFSLMGINPIGGTPEQFAQHIRSETEKWAKVVKDAGIQPQ